ncbi:hypothetical protein MJO29_013196 [Puccinia striiformis f. sp. tritici]|nr:hypothetical protein MJO29_013196 [Puccinia striiformis f. sp. tritici]KAI9629901.1 hypothetical protein KEM48_012540 [Puccinia striiformis f. sp. tritici PST-130]
MYFKPLYHGRDQYGAYSPKYSPVIQKDHYSHSEKSLYNPIMSFILRSTVVLLLAVACKVFVVEADMFPFNCEKGWTGQCFSIIPDPVEKTYKVSEPVACLPPDKHQHCCDATIYNGNCCPPPDSEGNSDCTRMN